MTQITTIYAAFESRMAALFASHNRLTNVNDLAQNNEQFLALGWGLLFGPAENTNRSVSKVSSVERTISVHLTRKVVARELDPTKKADADKALLEDLQILIDAIESNFTLETGSFVVLYVNDTGIVQVHTEKGNFIAITATVTVEYFRNL